MGKVQVIDIDETSYKIKTDNNYQYRNKTSLSFYEKSKNCRH